MRETVSPITFDEVKEKMMIIADPIATQQSASTGRPVYKLMYLQNGVPINLLGEGKFFRPDEDAAREDLLEKIEEDRIEQAIEAERSENLRSLPLLFAR